MLDWSDPERAAGTGPTGDTLGARREPGLPKCNCLKYAAWCMSTRAATRTPMQPSSTLETIAQDGDASAVLAVHYLKAYSLYEHDHYAAASAELSRIDIESIATDAERYRFAILRGNTLRTQGQAEAALPFLERGLDLA